MSPMLPAEPAYARSLTAVLPDVLASVQGHSSAIGDTYTARRALPPVRAAIVLLIDGLGAVSLSARAGHARFLAASMRKKDIARSVFPTTTAVALTSLTTGTDPGAHGIVGYRVRVPGTAIMANQLSGWESDGLDAATWQRQPTLFELGSAHGVRSLVVNREKYRNSGFTRAAFRGSAFSAAETLDERLEIALDAVASGHHLVYVYAGELDAIGHRHGAESDEWVAALETADTAVRACAASLPADIGMVVTADHGMVDVPQSGHILLRDGDDVLAGVAAIGGEPRMLHVYAEPGEAADVLERWRSGQAHRSWVLSRAEAVAAGLFGQTEPDALARVGDVLVAARSRVAYYEDRTGDKRAQSMVGQHGSLTAAERLVPLIRLGAYAKG